MSGRKGMTRTKEHNEKIGLANRSFHKQRLADGKICPRCNQKLSLDHFGIRKNRSASLESYCISCKRAYANARARKCFHSNAEYRERSRALNKETVLRLKFGMSLKDYQNMLDLQGGACAICKGHSGKKGHRYHVDHCHSTGKVRGLLCSRCNLLLGKAKDDVGILIAAVNYLENPDPRIQFQVMPGRCLINPGKKQARTI